MRTERCVERDNLLVARVNLWWDDVSVISASEGDNSDLAMLSQAYDLLVPNMSIWGEFFAKGYSTDYNAIGASCFCMVMRWQQIRVSSRVDSGRI